MPKGPHTMSHKNRTEPYRQYMSTESTMPPRTFGSEYTSPSDRGSAAWSQEDDSRLMQFRAQGMNWGPIASHFPPKTPNACRKRHERLMEKKNAESWDGIKIEDLARAYLDVREQMWKILAEQVGEKWTTVETKCMEKGLKTLQTAGRAARRHSAKQSSPFHHSQQSENEFDDSGLGFSNESPSMSSSHLPPPVQAPPAQQHHSSPFMHPYALNPTQAQRAGSIGSASSANASIAPPTLPMQQQHQHPHRYSSYSSQHSQQSQFSAPPSSASYMPSNFGGGVTFSPTNTGFSSHTLPSFSRGFENPSRTGPLPPLLPSLLTTSRSHQEPITASY